MNSRGNDNYDHKTAKSVVEYLGSLGARVSSARGWLGMDFHERNPWGGVGHLLLNVTNGWLHLA